MSMTLNSAADTVAQYAMAQLHVVERLTGDRRVASSVRHRRRSHYAVSLSKALAAKYWFNPERLVPTELLLTRGRKESKQINKTLTFKPSIRQGIEQIETLYQYLICVIVFLKYFFLNRLF